MKTCKVALIQMQAGTDPVANLATLKVAVDRAAAQGAELICGPELCYYFGDLHRLREYATPIPGPVTDEFARWAREHRITLIPGSLPERGPDGKVYNTLPVLGPDGTLLGRYRKRKLFWVDIPGKVTLDERQFLAAGEEPPLVVATPVGRIGLSLCFELRFPAHYQELGLNGAEIIIISSAFTYETGKDHWNILCRARAIETLSYVLAPNQWGQCPPAPRLYGHSLIISPWGELLGEGGGEQDLVLAELQPGPLTKARSSLRRD